MSNEMRLSWVRHSADVEGDVSPDYRAGWEDALVAVRNLTNVAWQAQLDRTSADVEARRIVLTILDTVGSTHE